MVRAFAERITDFTVPTSVLDYQAHNTATHHQTRRFGPFTGKRFWGCYTILELSRFFLKPILEVIRFFHLLKDPPEYSRCNSTCFCSRSTEIWACSPPSRTSCASTSVTFGLQHQMLHWPNHAYLNPLLHSFQGQAWAYSCFLDPSSILPPSCCLS
jgi:hypothetical protein